MRPTTDGVITVRPPVPGDAAALVAGRDDEFQRFMGDGSPDPRPVACIEVGPRREIVGWVDFDTERDWLEPGEVNVGYNVFARHRGHGYATRAVQLLMHHLAVDTEHRTATLLIDPANRRSLALAGRADFALAGYLDGNPYFKRPVPPLSYGDGVVTIRGQRVEDMDAHLAAIDDEQITWLWLPGHRESWEAMSPAEQRVHQERVLRANRDAFGSGPKWTFSVDTAAAPYVAYVDCDLANEHVPPGEANISYAAHPAHRGKGYVSRSVRLVIQFVRDHTGAREVHVIVDAENLPSLRVARAVGATEGGRWVNAEGRTMVHHMLGLR